MSATVIRFADIKDEYTEPFDGELTEEQREMVTKSHNLIYKFLHTYNLSVDDYYGVAAEGLCEAAWRYGQSRRVSSFSHLAYICMRSRVYNELKSEKCAKRGGGRNSGKVVSLEEERERVTEEMETVKGLTFRYISAPPIMMTTDMIEKVLIDQILWDEIEQYIRRTCKFREIMLFNLLRQGYKVNEISDIMGVDKSTVYRLRRRLAEKITERFGDITA